MTYPIRVLSLGAGVQSTTLLRMIIHGELEPVQHAIFSDTGWEPRAVYDHLELLKTECEQADIPLHVVSNGNRSQRSISGHKRKPDKARCLTWNAKGCAGCD